MRDFFITAWRTFLIGFALQYTFGLTPAPAGAAPASLSVPPALSCVEGGSVQIPITTPTAAPVSLPFGYRTTDGTAKAGQDYVALIGNQSIRKRARSYTLTLRCTPDNVSYTGDKTLTFTITSRNTAVAVIANGISTIAVRENEPVPPPPAATLHIEAEAVIEGGIGRAAVTRQGDLSQSLFVNWRTVNDTAVAPGDYGARSGGQTMGPGVGTISFTFPTVDDKDVEPTEQVGIVATAGTISAKGVVPITDNDTVEPPPPPPPGEVTCADGTKLPAGSVCPIMTWLPGTWTERGGYARAMVDCESWGTWKVAGPKADGTYDVVNAKIVAGVVYPVIVWGYAGFGGVGNVWALDLGNGESAYFRESCLEPVRPSS
jgi:hypothetical protein